MAQKTWENPGVLTRELYVRVVDISASGCLIESRRRLELGTIARLRLNFGNEEYADDVEVVRCEAMEGVTSAYHVGVRYLWTTPRHPGSIRHAVAFHVAELETSDTPRLM
jgi:hypothetical protein